MRKALASVTLIAAGLVGASPSALASDRGISPEPPIAHAIGDSVLLGAREQLRELGVSIDAVEGRQPQRLPGAIEELPDDGRPVVVHLGTNGRFEHQTCRELQKSVDGLRDVVLVTVRAPRPWVSKSNDVIRSCARRFEESTAVIAPWHRIAAVHSHLVYSDGIHLRPEGADVFVDLIREKLGLCQDPNQRMRSDQRAQVGRNCERSN